MKIRIGICDDSDHDRHYLKSIIKNYFKGREIEPEIVEYGSGEEFFRKPDVEILFLDIEMNALDGIMVKNELQKLQAETRIVFTTSHNDLMRECFWKAGIWIFSKTRFTERSGKVFKRNSKRFRRRELCSDQRCRKRNFCQREADFIHKSRNKIL